ncbi:RagB/SusD family nutrient uptake outer membrane protein [Dysgonomonas capnocytophagoides]|uniref:RagB/SusD family nutrient uptake outer membrane protein n=1 Tax=Dysgonomonas capnocytophagoides TaxID=45254 RepID=UPI00291D0888|nr:RagB/SusD family nutrient uptake outer membrane protein [Dysgonomonas capnocytophagoides]
MNNNKYIILLLSILIFNSCNEFLDQEPQDTGTEAIYYKTPEHFKAASNSLLDNVLSFKNGYGGDVIYDHFDKSTDIGPTDLNRGQIQLGMYVKPETNTYWSKTYEYIRNANIIIEKAEEYQGDKDGIKKHVAVAYFFRAWQHFFLLQRFGGVPIVTKVLDPAVDKELLYAARNSRYEVIKQIINDLEIAITDLPKEKDIADVDKGQISKEAAMSFLARVTLYEATWEKYVGTSTDGDGTNEGAGSTKPDNYPSVTDMLSKAKEMSGNVIAEAQAGTFKLWNEADTLSYYYLFSLEDAGSNPYGKTKASNKEYIFKTKYDFEKKQTGLNISHATAFEISADLGNMFLCRNGLPIIINGSYNPDFKGYDKFEYEFYNRDYRFVSSTYLPNRYYWSYGGSSAGGMTVNKPFPDPADGFTGVMKKPALRNTSGEGYSCRKFMSEHAGRETRQESYDYPQIRLAEVYLIYAEATCELGNGSISQTDLDMSINMTRARAGIDPLTASLIAGKTDERGKPMTLLGEIRRERACELFSEGFRFDDLKRWNIAEEALNGIKLGIKITGTQYEDITVLGNDGKPAYDPVNYPLRYGVDNATGRAIAVPSSVRNFKKKDYLWPIPNKQILLNSSLKQNPGW